MNAPNQQGIMGLAAQGRMPQPQQQQQQPQGQPLNPQQRAQLMPGMGTPDQLAAMYHNKPQELQQSYAMSPDLMKSLALMKIKQALDSKSREDMIEKASKEGKPQTVTDKLESEVADQGMKLALESLNEKMGRQEQPQQPQGQQNPGPSQQQVAQNVAGKNPALDQGIAAAPGAQSAAQPQAMAAGGIVAFAEGGDEGLELDKAQEARDAAKAELQSFGPRKQHADPEGYVAARRAYETADAALNAARGRYEQSPGIAALMKPIGSPQELGAAGRYGLMEAMQQQAAAAGGGRGVTPPQAPPAQASEPQVPPQQTPPQAPPAPPAPPRPQPTAAPQAQPGQPSPGMTGYKQGAAGQAAMAQDPFLKAALEQAQTQPGTTRESAYTWAADKYKPVQEKGQQAIEEAIRQFQALQPADRTTADKVSDMLMRMGESRYLGMGLANAARGETAAMEAQRARKMEIQRQLTELRLKGVELDKDVVKDAVKAGDAAYTQAMQSRSEATRAGVTGVGAAETVAANMEMERMRERAQRELNALKTRELNQQRDMALLARTQHEIDVLQDKVRTNFLKNNPLYKIMQNSDLSKLKEDERTRFETADNDLKSLLLKVEETQAPVVNELKRRLGMGAMPAANITPELKARLAGYGVNL